MTFPTEKSINYNFSFNFWFVHIYFQYIFVKTQIRRLDRVIVYEFEIEYLDIQFQIHKQQTTNCFNTRVNTHTHRSLILYTMNIQLVYLNNQDIIYATIRNDSSSTK